MNKGTLKALGITQKDIDALDVILNSASAVAPLAVVYLQTALRALEPVEAAQGTKDLASQKGNQPGDAGRQRRPSGLDSLGGGNIL